MILGPVKRFLERRRFPTLLVIAALLLAADLVIPDALPFVDELLLTIVTIIFGSWRKRKAPEASRS
ncbi:MAG: hypothetical protein Kow0020_05360 [Wenzhouxiangellaceae bacterium]